MTDIASLSLEQLERMLADRQNEAVRPVLEKRIREVRAAGAPQVGASGEREGSGRIVRMQPCDRSRPAPGATLRKQVKPKPVQRTAGLDSLCITLLGAPRTKKNHSARLMNRGKPSVVPSEAWMKWRNHLRDSGQVQAWMRLKDQRYNCAARFFRDRDTGDATGYYQGLADVLEEVCVVSNDRLLVTWDGSELLVDRENPRVEIRLSPINGAQRWA